jgi:Holliday junction resolvase
VRRAAKVDANHRQVAQTLRRAGCNVLSLAALAGGAPDLLCHRAGNLYLVEVKNGDLSRSRRKLTELQVRFHQNWPVAVVTSEMEALEAVGLREPGRLVT